MIPQSGENLPLADAIFSSFPRILADPASSRVLLTLWASEAPEVMLPSKSFSMLGKSVDFSSNTAAAINKITLADISNSHTLNIFREVVLRLWRACSSPDSQTDRLQPFESVETLFIRENKIRQKVGLIQLQPLNSLPIEGEGILSRKLVVSSKATSVVNSNSKLTSQLKQTTSTSYFGKTLISSKKSILEEFEEKEETERIKNEKLNAPLASKASIITRETRDNIELVDHLYTPFNCRELLWSDKKS